MPFAICHSRIYILRVAEWTRAAHHQSPRKVHSYFYLKCSAIVELQSFVSFSDVIVRWGFSLLLCLNKLSFVRHLLISLSSSFVFCIISSHSPRAKAQFTLPLSKLTLSVSGKLSVHSNIPTTLYSFIDLRIENFKSLRNFLSNNNFPFFFLFPPCFRCRCLSIFFALLGMEREVNEQSNNTIFNYEKAFHNFPFSKWRSRRIFCLWQFRSNRLHTYNIGSNGSWKTPNDGKWMEKRERENVLLWWHILMTKFI